MTDKNFPIYRYNKKTRETATTVGINIGQVWILRTIGFEILNMILQILALLEYAGIAMPHTIAGSDDVLIYHNH